MTCAHPAQLKSLKKLVVIKIQRKSQLITFVIMSVVEIHYYLTYNILILLVKIGFIVHIKINMISLNIITNLTAYIVSRNVVKIVLIR